MAPINFCVTAPPHGVVLTAAPAGGVFSGPGVVGNRFNPADAGPGRYTLSYTWNFPGIDCPVVASQTVEVDPSARRLPADTVLCPGTAPVSAAGQPRRHLERAGRDARRRLHAARHAGHHRALPTSCPAAAARRPTHYRAARRSVSARLDGPGLRRQPVRPGCCASRPPAPGAAQVQWDFGDGSAPATGAVVEHVYRTAGRFQPQATLPGTGPPGPCADQLLPPWCWCRPAAAQHHHPQRRRPERHVRAATWAAAPAACRCFRAGASGCSTAPDYHNDWAGAGLPAGLYYYLLRTPDGAGQVKGWVEIVR